MSDVSTLSKKFKSREHKTAASARNRANGDLRASLHSQKAATNDAGKRTVIQVGKFHF